VHILTIGGRELFIGDCILEGDTKRSFHVIATEHNNLNNNMDEYILGLLCKYDGILGMCGH
jgi:hypothetical protein